MVKGTYYKYLVTAQDSNGKVIAIAKIIHSATKGGKVTNAKNLKADKKKITLKAGKKFKLKVKQVPQDKKAKIKNHRKISFESSNTKVATVNKKGVIKAKKKGKGIVWIYAQNGVSTKVKITVK